MFRELDDELLQFYDTWEESIERDASGITLDVEDVAYERCSQLLDTVEAQSNLFNTDRLSIEIETNRERYKIEYNPSKSVFKSSQGTTIPQQIHSIYENDQNLVDIFTDLKNDVVSSQGEINKILQRLDRLADIRFDIEYTIARNAIADAITAEYGEDALNVEFYFELDWNEEFLPQLQNDGVRDVLLSADGSTASLIVILREEAYVRGESFAIYGLSCLDESEYPFAPDPTWVTEMDEIQQRALIQNPDENILPPSFFRFDETSDPDLRDTVDELFRPFILLFSILSLANTAELRDNGTWNVRIKGRQFIEGDIRLSLPEGVFVSSNEIEELVPADAETVDNIYSLYTWVYTNQSDERITVVRNVATLYARNLVELLTDADTVLSSAESNRQYYIQDSFDEFFEFRQGLVDSALDLQSKFVSLRSELMSDLSRDLFRTFAFVIAIAATAVFSFSDVIPPRWIYTGVSIILIGYVLVTVRRVQGIRRQFINLVNTHQEQIQYYERFFETNELEERGIGLDKSSPSLAPVFDAWWSFWGRDDDIVRPNYALAFDLMLYAGLVIPILLIALALLLEANGITNRISQIP